MAAKKIFKSSKFVNTILSDLCKCNKSAIIYKTIYYSRTFNFTKIYFIKNMKSTADSRNRGLPAVANTNIK